MRKPEAQAAPSEPLPVLLWAAARMGPKRWSAAASSTSVPPAPGRWGGHARAGFLLDAGSAAAPGEAPQPPPSPAAAVGLLGLGVPGTCSRPARRPLRGIAGCWAPGQAREWHGHRDSLSLSPWPLCPLWACSCRGPGLAGPPPLPQSLWLYFPFTDSLDPWLSLPTGSGLTPAWGSPCWSQGDSWKEGGLLAPPLPSAPG